MNFRQLTAAMLCLTVGVGIRADEIANGSLEDGNFVPPTNNTMSLAPGATDLLHWEVFGKSVAWIGAGNPFGLTASEGSRFLDLTDYANSAPFGGVRQAIATVPGTSYLLSFDLGCATAYGRPCALTATAAEVQGTFTSPLTGTNNDWYRRQLQFEASGATTEISLAGLTGAGYIGLDGVSVRVLPERLLVLPDVNADGVPDIAAIRYQPTRAEIRSGSDGTLVSTVGFLGTGLIPLDAQPLADSDGNGVAELAVLAIRESDGRGLVEMRNLSGVAGTRQVWLTNGLVPVALRVIEDDADQNGIAELAVLSWRESDRRGVVEIKNAFGPTNPHPVWVTSGIAPMDLEIVPDADANGVPELAVLGRRTSDGRIAVEVRNAAGPTNFHAVWFMAGNTPVDLTVVPDAVGNSVPDVAVLSTRISDGRIVAEVKNAAGSTNPVTVWFAAGQTGLAVDAMPDTDGNGTAELAVLSQRASDGRLLVEVKNAAGPTNQRALWYPEGFTARDLGILPDLDGNGISEAAVLMIQDSGGHLVMQSRNAFGPQMPADYWFLP